jgi:hypothetical protein
MTNQVGGLSRPKKRGSKKGSKAGSKKVTRKGTKAGSRRKMNRGHKKGSKKGSGKGSKKGNKKGSKNQKGGYSCFRCYGGNFFNRCKCNIAPFNIEDKCTNLNCGHSKTLHKKVNIGSLEKC